jgi:hypothetical protein
MQDMIGLDRTNPSGTAAMIRYGNAHCLVAGWTTILFPSRWGVCADAIHAHRRANPHPTDAREARRWKSVPGPATRSPDRPTGPLRPGGPQAACQKPEKPPENEHQQMHRLIDSQHAGWLLLLSTKFVDNSFRTVFRLRFPHGPPKTLVMRSFLASNANRRRYQPATDATPPVVARLGNSANEFLITFHLIRVSADCNSELRFARS